MKKNIVTLILVLSAYMLHAQCASLDTVKAPANYDNLHVVKVASDSLSTTFVIFIKNEVKLHKHNEHTENVIVLEGKGKMRLGDKEFIIEKGDHVFIPKGIPHSVKVMHKKGMKVMSIQSPYFDGKDREIINE
ncbi:MAG TPA: cupin domain-containing protein [Flavobacteriales bacterium]|nr:cupin domain-containing protein [Flavobacteriales bacterium]